MEIVGVDLGGTKLALGNVVNDTVENYHVAMLPEDKLDDCEAITNFIVDTIAQNVTPNTKGIGIGVPSVVDRKNGIIYDVQNIPAWQEVHFKTILEKRFNIPAFIDNDVNCFALGEHLYGKGKDFKNFVGLCIGTGLGGGVIVDGHLLPDANCGSGEFGEMPYKGERFEDYCSGQFFKNKHNTNGKEVAEKAQQGDKKAIELFQELGTHLGIVIKTIMCAIDPEAIIIGGSIAAAREFFEDAMRKEISTFTYPKCVEKLVIEFATESKYKPILGAAAVCIMKMQSN